MRLLQMLKLKRSAVLLSLLLTNICFAQSLPFKNINRSNGLPADEITALAQDSSGFIWVGSSEGLYRYDGFVFKSFAGTLSSSILKLYVDRKGRIWVATLGSGLACLSPRGELLKIYNTSTHALIGEKANRVSDIIEDRQGSLWWTTTGGVFRLAEKDTALRRYLVPAATVRGNSFLQLALNDRGDLVLSGYQGLYKYNRSADSLQLFGDSNEEKTFFQLRKDFSGTLHEGSRIWYSNWLPELGYYDLLTNRATILYSGKGLAQPDFNNIGNDFFRDSHGGVWIATGNGVFWQKAGDARPVQLRHSMNDDRSLLSNTVYDVMEDREGNFWFATKGGISMAHPYRKTLTNIVAGAEEQYPYAGKYINDLIYAGNDELLVGTHNADGLYLIGSDLRVKQHWSYKEAKFDWVWHFFDDTARNRILVSVQEGMLEFDKIQRTVKKVSDSTLARFYPVTSFVQTSDSILWMSRYWNRILRYNLRTGASTEYDIRQLGEKPNVLYLSKDRENNLWIMAHQSGLWRFDDNTKHIVERIEYKNDGSGLKEPAIFFLKDIGDKLLLGYFSHGISIYDRKAKTFQHIDASAGLVSNNIRDAIAAKDGSYWIVSRNGLSRYQPSTGQLQNYGYEQGIIDNDLTCITELPDGRMIAGSNSGLVSFYPSQLSSKSRLGAPLITDFSVYGVSSLPSSKTETRLAADPYFSFEYISLFYESPTRVEYAYMLEGFDRDWIPAGNRRFVSYSHVPGGHYRFRVKARLPGGEWIESAETFSLFVQTPFYKRWWFFVLAALAVITVIYLLFLYRLRQALKVERMRTAISSDLHDEVGASLTSISLYSEMARQSATPEHRRDEFLQRIGERSRESIEKMSDIIWSINPENDSLQQLLSRMKQYASEMAEARNITLNWRQEGNAEVSKLAMVQRKNFYLFFKEAVNNAVRHAQAAIIDIDIDIKGPSIRVTVIDDGKGFDAGITNKGNGLKNMQRRAAELNASLTIDSVKDKGTVVTLEFTV